MTGPAHELLPAVSVTRRRAGLATNSSSSHSMVVIPEGREVLDMSPEDRYAYNTGFVAASAQAKRHVLAGMLVTQAPWLWGRNVVMPLLAPGTDLLDLNVRGAREAQKAVLEQAPFTAGWDAAPYEDEYAGQWQRALPGWIAEQICALCDLPPGTDLRSHWTASSLGGNLVIPRAPEGMGPDPVAWSALKTVMLDPSSVYLAPEENSWDELEELPSARPRFEDALSKKKPANL